MEALQSDFFILVRWRTITCIKESIASDCEQKNVSKHIHIHPQYHRSNDLRGLHARRPGCVWRRFGRTPYGGWHPLRNCILGIPMRSAILSRCLHQCCGPSLVDKVDQLYLTFDNYTPLNLRAVEHRVWILDERSGWYIYVRQTQGFKREEFLIAYFI